MKEYIRRLGESRDIRGFIESLKSFNMKDVADIYKNGGGDRHSSYRRNIDTLTSLFAFDIIGQVSDYSDATIARLKEQYSLIKKFSAQVRTHAFITDKSI